MEQFLRQFANVCIPILPEDWKLTTNSVTDEILALLPPDKRSDFVTLTQFETEKIEEKIWLQAYIYENLMRNYSEKSVLLDTNIKQAICKSWNYYKELSGESTMAKSMFLQTSAPTGIDWTIPLLFRSGLPQWPAESGLPPILIISSNVDTLTSSFIPFLQKQHLYLHADCFVVLEPNKVKVGQRKRWLENCIRELRERKQAHGVYVLAMTHHTLTSEFAASLGRNRRQRKKKSENPFPKVDVEFQKAGSLFNLIASSVRLLILDDWEDIGSMQSVSKLGVAIGDKDKIRERAMSYPGASCLALAYLISCIRSGPSSHLILSLSRRIPSTKAWKAYFAMMGTSKEPKDFKEHCVFNFRSPRKRKHIVEENEETKESRYVDDMAACSDVDDEEEGTEDDDEDLKNFICGEDEIVYDSDYEPKKRIRSKLHKKKEEVSSTTLLKEIIKEKDQMIVQLLEQIRKCNELNQRLSLKL